MSNKKNPKHIAIIPDGNRRWAVNNNLNKCEGYDYGVKPGVELLKKLLEIGIEEVTFFGFTKDNVKRPKKQKENFIKACVKSIEEATKLDTSILVVGDVESKVFPQELLKYTKKRITYNKGTLKVNFLINYGWDWDLKNYPNIKSTEISRIDLIVRWGGHLRLSGLLPVQSVYADMFVLKNNWPNYKNEDLEDALQFYKKCDVTLGG